MVNDVGVDAAVRLLAGTDDVLKLKLVTSWVWCESHPEMPLVRPRWRKDAESVGAVARMLEDRPDSIELMKKLGDTSKCKLFSRAHGGTSLFCYTHHATLICSREVPLKCSVCSMPLYRRLSSQHSVSFLDTGRLLRSDRLL